MFFNISFIPGQGELSSSSLATQKLTSPPHFYLASYLDNNLKALVFSQSNPVYISAHNNISHHFLSMEQNLSGSQAFIAFTMGDYNAIESRISSIEEGIFLSEIYPSFSFGLGFIPKIKITTNYPNIDIQGNISITNNERKIIIEDIGVKNSKEVVNVEVM